MKLKLCITLILILVATACISLTVLLIPLLVLPSLTVETVDYDPVPVECSLHEIRRITQWKLCRAAHSCRDDCARTPRTCSRLYVDYRVVRRNGSRSLESSTTTPSPNNGSDWTAVYVPLLINPRACGDPGGMDCEVFENLYEVGEGFPCHRSFGAPRHAVLELSWGDDRAYPLAFSIGLPLSLLTIAVVIGLILCFWYCRGSPGYRKEAELDVETERKYAFE